MRIKLHIQPSAKKTECVGFYDSDIIKIKLSAPPVDGAANKELIKFISKKLNLKKSAVNILMGEHSRDKLIEIPLDVTVNDIVEALSK
ncbi:YggU family protein [Deferribacteraceae bacterium V6Fe1]|nr:YggU family protein [Deferribacteraceae bacterium V6Fe1]